MRHYENKVAKEFPKDGSVPPNKAVLHKITLSYASSPYPISIDLKSDLYMSGQFSHVLQYLRITMGSNKETSLVQFLCKGTLPQNGPTSLGEDRIRTSTNAC